MQKIDILIPVFIDNDDRLFNLERVVSFLLKNETLNVYIKEYYRDVPKVILNNENITYSSKLIQTDFFNKMECVNEMFEESKSDMVAIYDVDVLVFKKSFIDALVLMETGYDVVYPYNGYFYNIPKPEQTPFLMEGKLELEKCVLWNKNSVGGCVIFKRDVFKNGGKCNPHFKNVGYDDNEIYIRFEKLGYKIGRTDYPLLHLDHVRSETAFGNNPYDKYNADICNTISIMTRENLLKEIEKWK